MAIRLGDILHVSLCILSAALGTTRIRHVVLFSVALLLVDVMFCCSVGSSKVVTIFICHVWASEMVKSS